MFIGGFMVWLAIGSAVVFASVVAGLWYVRTKEASALAQFEESDDYYPFGDYQRATEYAEFCPISRFMKEQTQQEANAVTQ